MAYEQGEVTRFTIKFNSSKFHTMDYEHNRARPFHQQNELKGTFNKILKRHGKVTRFVINMNSHDVNTKMYEQNREYPFHNQNGP